MASRITDEQLETALNDVVVEIEVPAAKRTAFKNAFKKARRDGRGESQAIKAACRAVEMSEATDRAAKVYEEVRKDFQEGNDEKREQTQRANKLLAWSICVTIILLVVVGLIVAVNFGESDDSSAPPAATATAVPTAPRVDVLVPANSPGATGIDAVDDEPESSPEPD